MTTPPEPTAALSSMAERLAAVEKVLHQKPSHYADWDRTITWRLLGCINYHANSPVASGDRGRGHALWLLEQIERIVKDEQARKLFPPEQPPAT